MVVIVVQGLTEDIKLEIDENTSLQQNLEKACNDVMRLKDELQTTHIEIERLTEQVRKVTTGPNSPDQDTSLYMTLRRPRVPGESCTVR